MTEITKLMRMTNKQCRTTVPADFVPKDNGKPLYLKWEKVNGNTFKVIIGEL